ncbi:hypothetical protein V6N12_075986 [Hibiscus sabdariffa]|uniref:Uncharacterized protein n=1 Tax=Hibiscus sabdariffa TaxID=183260 RepID=A0ABR2AXW9_9ROSI
MKGSGIIGSERAFSPIHLAKDIPSQGKRKQVRLGGVDDPVNLSFTGASSREFTLSCVSHIEVDGWPPGEDGTINATSPIPGMYVEISSCQAYEGLLSPMVGSNSLVRGGDSCTIKINYVDRRTILPGVLCPSQLVKTSISISDMPHLVVELLRNLLTENLDYTLTLTLQLDLAEASIPSQRKDSVSNISHNSALVMLHWPMFLHAPSQLALTHPSGPSNIAKDIPSQGKRKQVRLSSISPVLPSGNGGRYNIRFFLSSGKKGSRFTD